MAQCTFASFRCASFLEVLKLATVLFLLGSLSATDTVALTWHKAQQKAYINCKAPISRLRHFGCYWLTCKRPRLQIVHVMDALLLQVEKVQHPCVLTQLHKHRNVLGVIGVCHCPSIQSIGSAYEQFEQLCRQVIIGHEDSQLDCFMLYAPAFSTAPRCHRTYPEAFTLRCFAFQPSDKQVEEDKTDKKHLLMFPPAPATAGDGAPEASVSCSSSVASSKASLS